MGPGEEAIWPAGVPLSESKVKRGRPVLEPTCETREAPDVCEQRASWGGWMAGLGSGSAPSFLPALGWSGSSGKGCPLTIYQQGPEQAQAVDTDVPAPGEAVQALQDVLKQPGPLQLICGQSCGRALE